MSTWRKRPFIYEINTVVWLNELSQLYQKPINLSNIPEEILADLAEFRFDVIWLMGVWHRSEATRASALNYKHEYEHVLPNLTDEDVIGSAYAIGDYRVDDNLGGRDALASLRDRLLHYNMRLILDYVPNHVATDHPWVTEKTHYLIEGTPEQLESDPGTFFTTPNGATSDLIIAHGRDPNFPGWIDTAQINVFNPEYRAYVVEMLLDIAEQCDGLRCDMAMLVTNDIFARTWGNVIHDPTPAIEFWEEVIPVVKSHYPDFLFIAEVYWHMEYDMLVQGFDFTYDKRLYDRILDGDINQIRDHLHAALSFQERQVHFIENHDEPRAATSMGVNKERAAATLIATLPGSILLHDGQMTGRHVRIPVQIGRQPFEKPHLGLQDFYRKLLTETNHLIYQSGDWRLFEVAPTYPDHLTNENLLAYGWSMLDDFRLVVVNPTSQWSSGLVRIYGWEALAGHYWRIYDTISNVCLFRNGEDIIENGLRIEVEVYQSQIFRFERLESIR